LKDNLSTKEVEKEECEGTRVTGQWTPLTWPAVLGIVAPTKGLEASREVGMALTKKDFGILERFEFDIQPVGVKYLARAPEGIAELDQTITLCEMLKRAQGGEVFYAGADNHGCSAGLYILGQTDIEEQFLNGEFGAGLGVFCDTRAASRLYHYIPRIGRGVVHYAAFSPLEKLAFDPDVLIFLANTTQTEILLRAMSYKTGKMWSSRYSAAIGCAWLFVYPYLNGEINFISTGLGFGMRRRKLFPESYHFVSIPFDLMPSMLQTLEEMPWVPEPYKPNGLEYVKQLRDRLGLK
jgi:uncharacterized protein (DUF169 family)